MATSAPTMSALTTSVPVVMPDVAASAIQDRAGGSRIAIQRRGQAQLPRLAQLDAGHDLQRLEVEVGLVEAVEQHQPVGPFGDDVVLVKLAVAE